MIFYLFGLYIYFQIHLKSIVWHYKINVYLISVFFRSCKILLENSKTDFETANCKGSKAIKSLGLNTVFGCFSTNAYIFVEIFSTNGVIKLREVKVFGSECLLSSKDLISHEFLFETFKKKFLLSIIFKNIYNVFLNIIISKKPFKKV